MGKQFLGLLLALAGGVLIIKFVPLAAWYFLLGALAAALAILLLLQK